MSAEIKPGLNPDQLSAQSEVLLPDAIVRQEMISPLEEEAPPEHCGIVVIIPKEPKKLLDTLYLAGSGVAHRGSDNGVGLLSIGGDKLKLIHAEGTYQQALSASLTSETTLNGNVHVQRLKRESIMAGLDEVSELSAVHVRYGTAGDYSVDNDQPSLEIASDNTEVSVSHNGEYPGAEKIRAKIRGEVSPEASDTILITKLLAQEIGYGAGQGVSLGENWDRAFKKVFEENPGAAAQFTFLRDPKTNYWRAYFSRDMDGIRPMIEGNTAEGDLIFASETVAMDEIGGSVVRSLRAGEITSVDSNGQKNILREGQLVQNSSGILSQKEVERLCVMEKIYFGRPDSLEPNPFTDPSEWRSYGQIRDSIGARLAELYGDQVDLDFVVGVPKSGIPYAEGFSRQSRVPYQGIIIHDLNMRVFMQDQHRSAMRALARSKFKIDKRDILKGARVGVFDDTLIRGTEAPAIINLLKDAGASQVDLFLGYTPYNHTCHLGMSTRNYTELAGHRLGLDPYNPDTQALSKEIGAHKTFFLPPADLIELTSLPGHEFKRPNDPTEITLANDQCGGCIFGNYPVDKDGERQSARSSLTVLDRADFRRFRDPNFPEFVHAK